MAKHPLSDAIVLAIFYGMIVVVAIIGAAAVYYGVAKPITAM